MKKKLFLAFSLVTLLNIPIKGTKSHIPQRLCFSNKSFCPEEACNKKCCFQDFSTCGNCQCNSISHTYFSVRPQYQSASPEKVSFIHDRLNIRENGYGGAVQLTLFGGRSTSNEKLATYFAPFCKTLLHVKESVRVGEDNPDILSRHFNVTTTAGNFESEISFCPSISVFGIGFSYKQSITKLINDEENEKNYDVFFEISSPLTRVATSMHLEENIKESGETNKEFQDIKFFNSITAAFQQQSWCYGKIDSCCKQSKWGLADIEVNLGIQKEKGDHNYNGYIGVLLPTGNRPSACYVFEPIVGHAKHFGIAAGGYVGLELWKNKEEERALNFLAYLHAKYLFSGREMRSIDLKGKPWSRYMQMYKNKDEAIQASTSTNPNIKAHLATPGINILTQYFNVQPRYSCNFTGALSYAGKFWRGELGYSCFARQSECLELLCPWKQGPALKTDTGGGIVNKLATINENNEACVDVEEGYSEANYNANLIKVEDLDFDSASHPAFISHTIYGNLGYRWDEKKYPVFVNIGTSYEFGRNNFILNRWTLWGKIGFSF